MFDSMRSDTSAHALADLHALLLAADWELVRNITGGHVYRIISPSTVDLKAKVLVQDDLSYRVAHPTADIYNVRSLIIQFMNEAETVASYYHQIRTDSVFASFQVVIGFCQLFISSPGIGGGGLGNMAGGIPWIPLANDPCLSLPPPSVTDIWWSCGGSQFAFDFRQQADCYAGMTFYRNGVAVIAPENNSISPHAGYLRLLTLTATNTFAHNQITWPTITYSSHQPLNIDALVSWEWTTRGQLWDAYVQTAATALDTLGGFTDEFEGQPINVSTIAWHSDFFSTLQLITEVAIQSVGNVAY